MPETRLIRINVVMVNVCTTMQKRNPQRSTCITKFCNFACRTLHWWGKKKNATSVVVQTVGDAIMPILREREMFYLTTHSTHFIYGYMASDMWLRTILIVRKETRCRHIGYSYRLTARVLLYAPSHRQDNTYHGLCYTSRGALAGTRNSSPILKSAQCYNATVRLQAGASQQAGARYFGV